MRSLCLLCLVAIGCAGAKSIPQGHLLLRVKPAEARVLLEERYIGSAAQLSGHRLRLGAGRRRFEITAEGHYSVRREADVRAGAETQLTVELHPVPEGEAGN